MGAPISACLEADRQTSERCDHRLQPALYTSWKKGYLWEEHLWGLPGFPKPGDLWRPALLKFRDFFRQSKLLVTGCRQLENVFSCGFGFGLSWGLTLQPRLGCNLLRSPGWHQTYSNPPALVSSSGITGICQLTQWDPDLSAWLFPVRKAICPGMLSSGGDMVVALLNCQQPWVSQGSQHKIGSRIFPSSQRRVHKVPSLKDVGTVSNCWGREHFFSCGSP